MPSSRSLRRSTGAVMLLLVSAAAAQELPFTHFTTERDVKPLPSASVQRVHQDRLGYLWIGLFGSRVARYDGHTFEEYGPDDGVPDFTVREIVEARDGRLWIGADSGLAVSDRPLDAYAPGQRVRFVTRIGAESLLQTRIRQNGVVAGADGWVWAGTQADGIFRYQFDRAGRLTIHRVDTDPSPGVRAAVVALGARRDGSVWVSLNTGDLFVYGRGATTRRKLTAPCTVSTFHESRSGVLWGGCMHGPVWRFDAAKQAFEIVSREPRAQINAIQETARGDLWVGTFGSGILRLDVRDPAKRKAYSRREGMPGSIVWDILEDREGNLWFAQEGGLSRLHPEYPAFLAFSRALPDAAVSAVLPARTAGVDLWVGTAAGLVAIRGDEVVAKLGGEAGLYSDAIYSLFQEPGGRLWIGTSRGLHALVFDASHVPATATTREVSLLGRTALLCSLPYDNNPVYSIRSLDLSGRPTLWFAGTGSLRAFVDGRWYFFPVETGVSPTGATSVDVDKLGHLWVGTSDRGLLRSSQPFTVERLQQLPSRPHSEAVAVTAPVFSPLWNRTRNAPTNSVRAIAAVGDEVWVGTARGLAVFRADGPRLAQLLRTPALGGELIAGIARSPRTGTLWVSQNRGLAEVDPATRRVIRVVTKDDGLVDDESWSHGALAIDAAGTILLATPKGLTLYRPHLESAKSLAPLLRLRHAEVRQDNQGRNETTIRFAGLTFASEEKIRYRTRLVGHDDWSKPSASGEAHYVNLPAFFVPRTYRFEVVASNDEVVWSAPAAYTFRIQPAWWLRWWACLGYALAFFFLLDLMHRYRAAKLQRLNRLLQKRVDQRTEEIQSQAAELETLDHIVRIVSREIDLENVLKALVDQVRVLFPMAEKSFCLTFDQTTQRSDVAAVAGYDHDAFRSVSYPTLIESIRRNADRGEKVEEGVFLVRDLRHSASLARGTLPLPKAVLAMEVMIAHDVEGLFVLDSFSSRDAFTPSDVQKLKRFREHARLAILKAGILGELQDKNREAHQASAAKSMFLANMSHELRTPMNAIIGFSAILMQRLEGAIDAKYANFLRMIHTSGQHLLNIINDILDLSKIEAGKMEFFPEPFSVREAVEGVCQVMRGFSVEQQVTFHLDIPDDLPPIESDASKFKQILYNLVSNAVKFSPPGSSVTIAARHRMERDGDTISVSVADQGVGIAPEHVRGVFEEFRQIASQPNRTAGSGTGLGLALVRRFVELQGGTVSVKSAPGKGSTFEFTLPVRFRGVATEEDRTRDWPQGDRVLVVEDDGATWESMRETLQSAAYIPIRARRGDEAIELARVARPVVITLDVLLPDIDGWEVLKALKTNPETRDVPVIIVSMVDNRDLGFALGADEYFMKPVVPEDLLLRLETLRKGVERR